MIPNKTKAIRSCPTPSNVFEVRSFFGLAGYYTRFISRFSKIATPLTQLTRRSVPFNWTEDHEKSFETLKEKLTLALVLTLPSNICGFIIYSSASMNGLGCLIATLKSYCICFPSTEII